MSAQGISSEKELRKTSFFNVFYGLYDEDDTAQACIRIIQRLDPDAPVKIKEAQEKMLELDVLMKDLENHKELCHRWIESPYLLSVRDVVHVVERAHFLQGAAARRVLSDPLFRMAAGLLDSPTTASLKQTIDAYTKGPDLKDVYCEFLEKIESSSQFDGNRIASHPLATYFCADKTRYDRLLHAIRQQQLDALAPALENRITKGLHTISLLSSDQDLIAYMGSTFHVSFQSIDAYTGLIYTAEYFDEAAKRYEETSATDSDKPATYNDALFVFSREERQACRQKLQVEAKAAKREREEQEEAERKKKDYNAAKRILEQDDSTASNLSQAMELFEKLGAYENSSSLLKQATKRHAEIVKREQLRADLCQQARQLVSSMYWYGNSIDGLTCRNSYSIPTLPKPNDSLSTKWIVLHCDEKSRCVYLWTQDSVAELEDGNTSSICKAIDMALFGELPLEARIRAKSWASLGPGQLQNLRMFVPTTSMKDTWGISGDWPSCEPTYPHAPQNSRYKSRNNAYLVYDWNRGVFCSSYDEKPIALSQPNIFVRPVICLDLSLTDEMLEVRRNEEAQREAYLKAFSHCKANAWDAAQIEFNKLGTYEDSERMACVCHYHYLYHEAVQCEQSAKHCTYEKAEKTYRDAARLFLEAEAAKPDAQFYDVGYAYAQKASDRCSSLAETYHASALLKRIAKLKHEKEILTERLETTPLERKQKDIERTILQKCGELNESPLLNFSKRRALNNKSMPSPQKRKISHRKHILNALLWSRKLPPRSMHSEKRVQRFSRSCLHALSWAPPSTSGRSSATEHV